MKRYCLLITILLIGINFLKAQLPNGNYSDYFREGNFLMGEENYDMALKNYLEAYKIDSTSANINYKIGVCYLNSSLHKEMAEPYLAKSLKNISKNYNPDEVAEQAASPLAVMYYAKALHINYKFDEALTQYNFFENLYAKKKETKEEVVYFKSQTIYAKEVVSKPVTMVMESMGDSINSSFPDYSPVLSPDESMLIYTTRRNTSTGGEKTVDGQYYEDIVVSYKNESGKWSAPKSISELINTSGHEGSVNLSADGQTLILFKDDGANGNVYFSSWNGKEWGFIQSFGSDVNTKYWESHACLTADKNTLYFVSDRPGGYGGRDIYRCVKLPNGAWSKAQNVGPTINTKYDEDGSFMHPDGITMIFASKGHKSMGGFDLFTTKLGEDNRFSEPQGMPYPINTTDDDVFFVLSPDGKRGYLSSENGKGGLGEKDIYKVILAEADEKPLALYKGKIMEVKHKHRFAFKQIPVETSLLSEADEFDVRMNNKEALTKKKPLILDGFVHFSQDNQPAKSLKLILLDSLENKLDSVVTDKNGYFKFNSKFASSDAVKNYFIDAEDTDGVLLQKNKYHLVKNEKIVTVSEALDNSKSDNDLEVVVNNKETGQLIGIYRPKPNGEFAAILDPSKNYNFSYKTNGREYYNEDVFVPNEHKFLEFSMEPVVLLPSGKMKPKGHALNTIVLNNRKDQAPVPNAKVTLLILGEKDIHFEVDGNGVKEGYPLANNELYTILAEFNGKKSPVSSFNTVGIKGSKTFTQLLYLDDEPVFTKTTKNVVDGETYHPEVACGSPVNYKYNFEYNANEVEDAKDWNVLIDGIVSKTKQCNPVVKIMSSASHVPTQKFPNNQVLASTRADNMEEKMKAAVNARGGDAKKIIFTKVSAVRGPQYEFDKDNTDKYAPYQYVHVIAR